jgi:hypothetical protein
VGSGQSVIKSNLDSAGQLPSGVMSWPTYSILAVGEEFTFLQLESDMVYFIKIEHTHSNYAKRVSRDVDQRRISSMIVRLPL